MSSAEIGVFGGSGFYAFLEDPQEVVVGREFYDYTDNAIESANAIDEPKYRQTVAELAERLKAGPTAPAPKQ